MNGTFPSKLDDRVLVELNVADDALLRGADECVRASLACNVRARLHHCKCERIASR
jgi:hypothetical protein